MSRTGQREVLGRVQQRRVGRQRQVGLGHAHREVAEAVALELLELLLRLGVEEDVPGAVDPRRDRLDLLPDRGVVVVELLEACSAARTRRRPRSARSAAPAPPFSKPSLTSAANAPASSASLRDELDLLVAVAGAAVDRHDARHAERRRRSRGGGARSPSRSRSPAARPARPRGVVGEPAVVLDRAHGRDEHRGARRELRRSGRRCRRTSPSPCPSRSPTRSRRSRRASSRSGRRRASCCRGRCSRTGRSA